MHFSVYFDLYSSSSSSFVFFFFSSVGNCSRRYGVSSATTKSLIFVLISRAMRSTLLNLIVLKLTIFRCWSEEKKKLPYGSSSSSNKKKRQWKCLSRHLFIASQKPFISKVSFDFQHESKLARYYFIFFFSQPRQFKSI